MGADDDDDDAQDDDDDDDDDDASTTDEGLDAAEPADDADGASDGALEAMAVDEAEAADGAPARTPTPARSVFQARAAEAVEDVDAGALLLVPLPSDPAAAARAARIRAARLAARRREMAAFMQACEARAAKTDAEVRARRPPPEQVYLTCALTAPTLARWGGSHDRNGSWTARRRRGAPTPSGTRPSGRTTVARCAARASAYLARR